MVGHGLADETGGEGEGHGEGGVVQPTLGGGGDDGSQQSSESGR
jgi:hypothetical protein